MTRPVRAATPTRVLAVLAALTLVTGCGTQSAARPADSPAAPATHSPEAHVHTLPAPVTDGPMSVEASLQSRRSRRDFSDQPLSLAHLSQLLWAAYGVTQPMPERPEFRGGLRTAPSAGALFPLEILVVVGNVAGLEPGVYRFDAATHTLAQVVTGDVRAELRAVGTQQAMLEEAPVTVVHTGVPERLVPRYGQRGVERYLWIEVGHSAQNVYLQAEALGLGTCAIGAFNDDALAALLHLPAGEIPLYLMPVGHPR